MALYVNMTISPAQKLNTNVWLAELDPGEVRSIGLCDQSEGIISIIRTGAAACPTNEGGVQVDPNDTRVLNVGRSSQAVIIVDPDPTAVVENGLPHAEEDRGRFESLGRFSGGDEEFLQSCTADLRSLALELLRNIRREFPGVLEFQSPSKKYKNTPDNFWTIKAQPRNRSLRLTVRGRPGEFGVTGLHLANDMSGYSAFKLTVKEQIPAALAVIRQAHQRGRHRRR